MFSEPVNFTCISRSHHNSYLCEPCLISSLVFSVKVLNQAKLDASVRAYGSGTEKITNKWPSPYVLLCGVCLLVSLFEHFWRPLKWFALGAVAAGILPILMRSFAAARRLTLDVNILMLIAGKELPLFHRDDASFDLNWSLFGDKMNVCRYIQKDLVISKVILKSATENYSSIEPYKNEVQ